MRPKDEALTLSAAFETMRDRYGLAFSDERRAAIARMLGDELARDMGDDLELGSAALDRLVEVATVGESYFFRDSDHFDFVRDKLIAACGGRDRNDAPFRIWSAGCAGGEEAYSLAILADRLSDRPGDDRLADGDGPARTLGQAEGRAAKPSE